VVEGLFSRHMAVEKLGTQNSGVVHPRRVGGLKLSGCPAQVKQPVDQTSDPVSSLSSIQSAKRRGSRSVVVQPRLGAFNYSFQEYRAVITSTGAEEQVCASRDKLTPARQEISAPMLERVQIFHQPTGLPVFRGKNGVHGRLSQVGQRLATRCELDWRTHVIQVFLLTPYLGIL